MGEETLVKEALTPEMIGAGRDLVLKLDSIGWKVSAAFWFFQAEENRWKLILASDQVPIKGPRNAYVKLNEILKVGSSSLSLGDISAVAPNHNLVRLLSHAVSTGGSLSGIRMSRNTVNGSYVHDCYIYKLP